MEVTKTFGRLEFGADETRNRAMYRVTVVPYIAAKLKRLFPRADASRPGVIMLKDTEEIARDLEWFTQRHPLEVDPATLAHLSAQAEAHRQREELVQLVMEGYRRPNDWRAPAMTPRDYQLAADELAAVNGFLLNGDDLGLGKTFTSLLRLRDPEALPAVVVCPTHLTRQWLAELNRALPWLLGHIVTKGTPYDPSTRRASKGRQPDVLIFTYGMLAGWADELAGAIQTAIFDEVHELRTGVGTYKWTAAATVAWKAAYRIGASATPVHNYGGEMWNIMEVLAPGLLGSRDEFEREWCSGRIGNHLVLKDPATFGQYLRGEGMMVARTRAELHRELPEPILIEQPVDSNHATIAAVAAQVQTQARILAGEIEADFTAKGRAYREIDLRMRQATGLAKAPYVAEFVRLLLESQERVVVWCWHRGVYEIMLEQLGEFSPVLYSGSETPSQKDASRQAFCGGPARVMLMSLKSGAGLDGLQQWCSVGVFAELDWSPEQHAQCVGRLARDGQPETVVAYYMTADDGTDPVMTEVLGVKKRQSVPIRRPDAQLFGGLTDQTDRAQQLAASVLRQLAPGKGAR